MVSGLFNLKRAHVNIKLLVVLKISGKETIQQSEKALEKRKVEVKNVLDGNKDSEIYSRSEVVERCECQRRAEHVINEPSVSFFRKITDKKGLPSKKIEQSASK